MKIIRNAPRDVFPFQASPEAEGYFPDTSPVTPPDLLNLPESADTMGHQSPGESLTSVDSSPLDLSVRGLSMHIVNRVTPEVTLLITTGLPGCPYRMT